MFKLDNIKTSERRRWWPSGVFIVTFEHISYPFWVFLLVNLNRQKVTGKSFGSFKERSLKFSIEAPIFFYPQGKYWSKQPPEVFCKKEYLFYRTPPGDCFCTNNSPVISALLIFIRRKRNMVLSTFRKQVQIGSLISSLLLLSSQVPQIFSL